MQALLFTELLVTLISNLNLFLSLFGSLFDALNVFQNLFFLSLSLLLLHSFLDLFELLFFFSFNLLRNFLSLGYVFRPFFYFFPPLLLPMATHRIGLPQTLGASLIQLIIPVEGVYGVGQVAELML